MCDKPFFRPTRSTEWGFSLIELMVGMVVALIATIVIFQVFAVNESYKRATTGGSDALQSGGFSTYTLSRLIGAGGAGFGSAPRGLDGLSAVGCRLGVYRNGKQLFPAQQFDVAPLPDPFSAISSAISAVVLAPALIVAGADADTPDVIMVMAGNHTSIGRHRRVISQGAVATPTITLADNAVLGINNTLDASGNVQHDLLLAVDQDPVAARDTGTTCDIAEATGTPTTTSPISLTATSTGFTGPYHFTNAGSPAYYSKSLNISNLGPVSATAPVPGSGPPFIALGVGNDGSTPNALLALNLITGYCPAVGTGCATANTWVPQSLADNIISIKALYGVSDDPAHTPVSSWIDPSATGWDATTLSDGSKDSTDKLRRVRAIRLAVIARNAQPEKLADDDTNKTPRFSPATFTLFGDLSAASLSKTVTNPDRHYRYKIFDTTIPLRNMILMPQNL